MKRKMKNVKIDQSWLTRAKFSFYITVLVTLGFFLATIPQIILDSRLKSHIRFPIRHYPKDYLITPCAIVMAITTFGLLVRKWNWKIMYVLSAWLPFTGACAFSLPIFKPEVPHGNLIHIWSVWTAIICLTVGISQMIGCEEKFDQSIPAEDRRIYIQELLQFYRNALVVIVGGYLALLVAAIVSSENNNERIVTDKSEVFLLNIYSGIQFGLISFAVLVGPVYQLAKQHHAIATQLIHPRK